MASSPGWTTGFVPTAAQWNAAFAGKVDSTVLSGAAITSNASGALGQLPANAFLLFALIRETAGHAVSVAIGTTSGGSDVMSAVAVPSSGTTTATTAAFTKVWFSSGAPQNLFLSSASWGGASINITLVYQIGP